jgi:hypothetical protein
MAEPRSDNLQKSREEAALLLRLDPQNLSASDALRCDLISTLRLSIDSAQADALEGRAADLGRLIVATESLVKLLPSEPPKPASSSPSPQDYMWKTYSEMRRRGALAGEGLDGLKLTVERLKAELASKDAEIARLTAALAGSVPLPDNVVKLPHASPTAQNSAVGAQNSAPPKPEPQPTAWDETPGGQAWHAWRDAGGDPWSI